MNSAAKKPQYQAGVTAAPPAQGSGSVQPYGSRQTPDVQICLVLDATANLRPYWQLFRRPVILGAIEKLMQPVSGGPNGKGPLRTIELALITFRGFPPYYDHLVQVACQFTRDVKLFVKLLERMEFLGGGESAAAVAEGMQTAQLLKWDMRCPDRHMFLVTASSPYEFNAQVTAASSPVTLRDVFSSFVRMGTHLSLVTTKLNKTVIEDFKRSLQSGAAETPVSESSSGFGPIVIGRIAKFVKIPPLGTLATSGSVNPSSATPSGTAPGGKPSAAHIQGVPKQGIPGKVGTAGQPVAGAPGSVTTNVVLQQGAHVNVVGMDPGRGGVQTQVQGTRMATQQQYQPQQQAQIRAQNIAASATQLANPSQQEKPRAGPSAGSGQPQQPIWQGFISMPTQNGQSKQLCEVVAQIAIITGQPSPDPKQFMTHEWPTDLMIVRSEDTTKANQLFQHSPPHKFLVFQPVNPPNVQSGQATPYSAFVRNLKEKNIAVVIGNIEKFTMYILTQREFLVGLLWRRHPTTPVGSIPPPATAGRGQPLSKKRGRA